MMRCSFIGSASLLLSAHPLVPATGSALRSHQLADNASPLITALNAEGGEIRVHRAFGDAVLGLNDYRCPEEKPKRWADCDSVDEGVYECFYGEERCCGEIIPSHSCKCLDVEPGYWGNFVCRPTQSCSQADCADICTDDVRECPDGTFVGRDDRTDCGFFPCPLGVKEVTNDGRCPVERPFSWEGCEGIEEYECLYGEECCCGKCHSSFACMCREVEGEGNFACWYTDACLRPDCVDQCDSDVHECPDGTYVSRDIENNCDFFQCEINRRGSSKIQQPCTKDLRPCPDGTWVGRDSQNDCDLFPCPKKPCTKDQRPCPDGTYVGRDSQNDCDFFLCPQKYISNDARCPERSPGLWEGCEGSDEGGYECFYGEECCCGECHPSYKCTCSAEKGMFACLYTDACYEPDCANCPSDILQCPDGTYMYRDSQNDCSFPPCTDLIRFGCPPKRPEHLSDCDAGEHTRKCEYDTDCCCGECAAAYVCACVKGGKYVCRENHFCRNAEYWCNIDKVSTERNRDRRHNPY